MKKILKITLLLIIAAISNAYSQYYYLPYEGLGKNPGGLNTDDEYPVGGGLPAGWTTILTGAQASGTYSAVQTMPFSFSFNGSSVTQFKVSNSGILTFNVSTIISPGTTNTSLPSASVPDKAVCVWGISGSGSNDNIVKKTFGTAPNRQHWICFTSYTSGAYATYFSIVLEETTNNIYIVDQKNNGYKNGLVTGLTLGVQINSTTAKQVAGSPNYIALSANNYKQGDNVYYTFIYGTQNTYDLEMNKIITGSFPNIKYAPLEITGIVRNMGTATINSFNINYSINGGTAVTNTLSGLSMGRFTTYKFIHPVSWNVSATGTYTLNIWTSNINGNADQNISNDNKTSSIIVSDTIPNIINSYLTNISIFNTIGTAANSLNGPKDLDFHPDLKRNELWVINAATEAAGGSTVTFYNAGKGNQTSSYKKDANSLHFMSLPTGIAFGDNGNFANSPGVYDANHGGGSPFTGPSLWSSDPAIYAQVSGGNGSHLDMLHTNPYCMGIAHEKENVYWVFDGNTKDIVRCDFVEGHGAGNDDHGDAIVWRYPVSVQMINNSIPSHLVLDKKNGKWLYIVDGGNARVLRLDITSGTFGGTSAFPTYEGMAQYVQMTGISSQVFINSGLVQPSGIDIIDNRLIVSDYSNGDIIIYDISGVMGSELGRIKTGVAGIAGVTIGPDGNIWYVNPLTYEVVRITLGGPLSAADDFSTPQIKVYPNPVQNILSMATYGHKIKQIQIYNLVGEVVITQSLQQKELNNIDVSSLTPGVYFIKCESDKGTIAERFQKIN